VAAVLLFFFELKRSSFRTRANNYLLCSLGGGALGGGRGLGGGLGGGHCLFCVNIQGCFGLGGVGGGGFSFTWAKFFLFSFFFFFLR